MRLAETKKKFLCVSSVHLSRC